MAKVKRIRYRANPKQTIIYIRKEVGSALQPVLQDHIDKRIEKAHIEKWSATNQPKFKKISKNLSNTTRFAKFIVMYTAPNARKAGIPVYKLLNDGTDERNAKMGFPYFRKTRGGSGGKRVLVSKNFQGRSPDSGNLGIDANDWDRKVTQELRQDRTRSIRLGVRFGLKRSHN